MVDSSDASVQIRTQAVSSGGNDLRGSGDDAYLAQVTTQVAAKGDPTQTRLTRRVRLPRFAYEGQAKLGLCLPLDDRLLTPVTRGQEPDATDSDRHRRACEFDPRTYDALLHSLTPEVRLQLGGPVDGSTGASVGTSPPPASSAPPFKIHPLLLARYLLALCASSSLRARDRDAIAAIADKAALLAVLPHIAAKWELGSDPVPSPEDLDTAVASLVESSGLLGWKPADSLLRSANYVQMGKVSLVGTVDITVGDSRRAVLVSVESTDRCLEDHLRDNLATGVSGESKFAKFWSDLAKVLDAKSWLAAKEGGRRVRADHSLLYAGVQRALAGRPGLGVSRLRHLGSQGADPSGDLGLPFIEFIDAKPMTWARQADALGTERKLAYSHLQYMALKVGLVPRDQAAVSGDAGATAPFPQGDTLLEVAEYMERLGAHYRLAARQYFLTCEKIARLRQLVQESGYDLVQTGTTEGLSIRRSSKMQRQVLVRVVAGSASPASAPSAGDAAWFRVEKAAQAIAEVNDAANAGQDEQKSDDPTDVVYDPVGAYLRTSIPSGAHSIEKLKHLRIRLGLPEAQLKDRSAPTKDELIKDFPSSRKHVHHFNWTGGVLLDQYGDSIDDVLEALDVAPTVGGVHERELRLFVIPRIGGSKLGDSEVTEWIVVHNPVAGRDTGSPMSIALIESYVHALEQVPGHWLGPVSHAVSLFPGETRRLRVARETRKSSSKRTETTTTMRTSLEEKQDVREQVRSALEDLSATETSSNWSASANAGLNLGVFSFGGGGGGGRTTANRASSVAKSLDDRVSHAASAASQQNEARFATVSEFSSEERATSEEVMEFSNPNAGSVITFKFFQLLHRYRSSLHLERVQAVIRFPYEIVLGTGIPASQTCDIRDLADALSEYMPEARDYWSSEVRSAVQELYAHHVTFDGECGLSRESFPISLTQAEHHVNSGSFIVESAIGRTAATEGYVDEARKGELDARKAASDRVRAEAEALRKGMWVLPPSLQGVALQGEGITLRATAPVLHMDATSGEEP